jgi:transposase
MERRSFTLEFTTEAVNLVRERGVAVSQTSRDLGLHVNVLCKWVRAQWREGIPGRGKMRLDYAEVARLKRELANTKAERDILEKSHRLLRGGTIRPAGASSFGLNDPGADFPYFLGIEPSLPRFPYRR